jgi:hypothetical protein
MATAADIATLRLLIAEPTSDTYTDSALGIIIDASDSLDAAALEVWIQKAAASAELVDISEGGSQRKNSDVYKNALLMVQLFQNRVDTAALDARRTTIGKLARQ